MTENSVKDGTEPTPPTSGKETGDIPPIKYGLFHYCIKYFVYILSVIVYRIQVKGIENFPATGGALIVSNHVSWLDGQLLMLKSPRPVRAIAFGGNLRNPIIAWMAGKFGIIFLEPGPKAIIRALEKASEALRRGEVVLLFAEGGISRTGTLQPFKPGLNRILEKGDAPVVPTCIDGMWGSVFSFSGGRFFWKMPKRWRDPITINFGTPIQVAPNETHIVREAVLELGAKSMKERSDKKALLPRRMIRALKRCKYEQKITDSMGVAMTGGRLLAGVLAMRRILRRGVIDDDEQYVGILLPPTSAAVLANATISLMGRTVVNLNYTMTAEVLNYCIRTSGIKHILTSRSFMEKVKYENLEAEIVYLEDLKPRATTMDKIAGAIGAYVTPAGILERQLGLHRIDPDQLLTLIFTSGSTGLPKGVMLSHENVSANVTSVLRFFDLTKKDTLLGILPFFHSFGYTIPLWIAMASDVKGAYHFSPLEPRQIGKLCREAGVTALVATPTFLRTWLKRVKPEDFATLNLVVAGAERLPLELLDAYEDKFGVRPIEGYGLTETAPVVAGNMPPSRHPKGLSDCVREGTIGRPLPGIATRVVDLDTGEPIPVDKPGMLQVKGANVMKGYFEQAEKTAEVFTDDGWFITGDVAKIDADGFITLTGRLSRFSKIGGEMVPHGTIEEILNKSLELPEDEPPRIAVTAVSSSRKGERLIVLHLPIESTPDQLRDALREAGQPNIFLPSADSFLEVEELPLLGTGKFDLAGMKKMAKDHFGED